MHQILVVEDDRSTNDRIRNLVESLKNTCVTQAFDRLTAEPLIEANPYDLVIVDIELGQAPKEKYGGLSLLSTLGGKRTVTIVVSGMPEENLRGVAISLRAYDFIGKPIDDIDFINKVERALAWHDQDGHNTGQTQGGAHTWPPNLEPDPVWQPGLLWKKQPVQLTLTQLRLVHCLIKPHSRVVEYAKLAAQMRFSNSPKAIATHISGVRRKFLDVDDSFDAIDSEPGKGYVWKSSS